MPVVTIYYGRGSLDLFETLFHRLKKWQIIITLKSIASALKAISSRGHTHFGVHVSKTDDLSVLHLYFLTFNALIGRNGLGGLEVAVFGFGYCKACSTCPLQTSRQAAKPRIYLIYRLMRITSEFTF
jgi:hypothetical protein